MASALGRLVFGKTELREQQPVSTHGSEHRTRTSSRRHRAEAAIFAQIHKDLAAALHAVPGTRKSLRYLAHLDRSLHSTGADALAVTPVRILRRAQSELGILLSVAPSSVGLVALGSRLTACLAIRDSAPGALDDASASAAFDGALLVSEASLADFDQAVTDSEMAPLGDS